MDYYDNSEEFRKLRDELNSGERKAVMIQSGLGWTFKYVDRGEIDAFEGWEKDLDGIEYNEINPDFFGPPGNLLGFIYPGHNCPAVLGYGHRDDYEILLMKYIWKSQK